MQEVWKTFADGNYEASNHGNVRRKTPGRRTWPGRPMVLTVMTIGYHRVAPTIGGRNVPMYVHAIVAELFIGPCPVGLEVNHKDGDKTNNRVDNLEYVTHQENMRHARRNNMIADKLTIPRKTIDKIIRLREEGSSYSQIVKKTAIIS